MITKPWYTSKTLIANGVMVAAAVLEATGVTDMLTPEVQAEVVALVMGAVNIAMRFVTRQPLAT